MLHEAEVLSAMIVPGGPPGGAPPPAGGARRGGGGGRGPAPGASSTGNSIRWPRTVVDGSIFDTSTRTRGRSRSRWKAARFSLRVTSSSAAPAMKPYALSDSFCRASGSYSSRFTGSIDLCPLSVAGCPSCYFISRRGAGVVYRDGLENRCPPCADRGFESHPLRRGPPPPPPPHPF